ncbi:hypothetical protein PAPYR_8248 [Paratrimastix pyriformis]|uniref:Uncharacterized protein n=1 Tax=Paratrimastix pyriformis TaxID=342808 RepID=A0ABQ8UB39_9EUKA|nr:hypothetical protein PAPYR_8248 [Paratrimastix pyriformis]
MAKTKKTKCMKSTHNQEDVQPPFSPVIPLLLRLPTDLLPVLVEVSDSPLQTYTRLLGLCHATRLAVRGTPRELAFFFGDADVDSFESDPLIRQVTIPTADALASLVGPCKGLVKLTLDFEILSAETPLLEHWCGTGTAWVDETFSAHSRLAVLDIISPRVIMPALPSILTHLRGLEEFRLCSPHQNEEWETLSGLLASLGRSCPRLRLLHLDDTSCLQVSDLQLLAPIAGTLKDLHFPIWIGEEPATAEDIENVALGADFLRSLTSVQKLSLGECPAALLKPLAPQLTQLCLRESCVDEPPLVDGLCQLKRLELPKLHASEIATFACLLTANMATLCSLSLTLSLHEANNSSPKAQLVGMLESLPHLTSLTLNLQDSSCAAVFHALPLGLLDRLEDLALLFDHPADRTCCIIRIASRHLRTLWFDARGIPNSLFMELACPILEELALPESVEELDDSDAVKELVLDCPRLRSITGLPDSCHNRWTAMPHLERVRGITQGTVSWNDDDMRRCLLGWLPQLLEGSPRLREVPHLAFLKPSTFNRLLESHSLTRLSVSVSVTALPILRRTRSRDRDLCALRLPAQLERLRATVDFDGTPPYRPPDLLVEALGLRSLIIYLTPDNDGPGPQRPATLSLCCPALMALDADLSRFALFDVGPCPQLLNLAIRVHRADAVASLSTFLTAATALRRVTLNGDFSDLPPLAAVLGRLPQLTVLDLAGLGAEEVALACPHLKLLKLGGLMLRSVELDCPRLHFVELWEGDCRYIERFELVGSRPPSLHFRHTEGFDDVVQKFPWMREFATSP